jgi:signal transduction histidine kinase
VHDHLLRPGVVPRERGLLFHYGAAPVIVVFGWVLLLRFVEGLGEVEALNRDLEQRVREKTAEIERGYHRLARVEAERARGEERERILREVHDGVGSHIVATLALLESGQGDRRGVADALRTALDELRLTVDTLGPGAGRDAVTALAMLRRRVQPSLEAAGLRLAWRVDHDVPLPTLGDELTLDLLRIVQEALANALQHAAARAVEVSIRARAGGAGLEVAVTDDGGGFRAGAGEGRGLANMRRRAERLGAVLEVTSSAAGTRVAVVLRAPA